MSDGVDGRRARWEATHRRIYDVAMKLFQEHGFDNVNVGQVVAAAEITPPTFYNHFDSLEHIVMQLPTAAEMELLLSTQPSDLPVGTRMRQAAPVWFSQWGPAERADMLARWKVIASSPSLRTRAASFERATADLVAGALPPEPGSSLTPAEQVIVNAHLAAFTMGLLAWADSDGRENLEEIVDAAFAAVQRGAG